VLYGVIFPFASWPGSIHVLPDSTATMFHSELPVRM
jgi:hypothetical protein